MVGCGVLQFMGTVIAAHPGHPRGALILTMAGSGAPPYLQASCLSVASSASRFDMLIFHEDNELIHDMRCAENVVKINLHHHGLARLIAAAVCQASDTPGTNASHQKSDSLESLYSSEHNTCGALKDMLETVLSRLPYFLAQFKIGSGDIFAKYLTQYTHWTYTDPDIIWGDLSEWLTDEELNTFDVITVSKYNDAHRLFLRGQFSLHRNEASLNRQWADLPYMTADAALSRMIRITELLKKDLPIARLKRLTFVSAEGAYSTHIFKSGLFSVLVTGRMMSDRVTKPVIWTNGSLLRCHCDSVAKCLDSVRGDQSCLNPRPSLDALHIEMSLIPFRTTRNRYCGMGWLSKKDQLCGVPLSSKTITNDAVLFKGHQSWQLNNDTAAPRSHAKSGAMFHFRVWEDVLSTSLQTTEFVSKESSTCIITYLDLARKVTHLSPCDVPALQSSTVIVQSWGEWLLANKRSQVNLVPQQHEHKHIEKNKDDRTRVVTEPLKSNDDFFYKIQ